MTCDRLTLAAMFFIAATGATLADNRIGVAPGAPQPVMIPPPEFIPTPPAPLQGLPPSRIEPLPPLVIYTTPPVVVPPRSIQGARK